MTQIYFALIIYFMILLLIVNGFVTALFFLFDFISKGKINKKPMATYRARKNL